MIRARDPAEMTPAERLAEIATLLAAGYLRLQVSRPSAQNSLADSGQPTPSCGSGTTSPRSNEDVA